MQSQTSLPFFSSSPRFAMLVELPVWTCEIFQSVTDQYNPQKFLILHRINGYLIFLLYLLGAVGGFIITTHAYGGHIDTQTAAGALAILVLVAFAIAWVNIKRLQIDQHRKWMLCAINLMASIVTSRIILAIATAIVAHIGMFAEASCFHGVFKHGCQFADISNSPGIVASFSSQSMMMAGFTKPIHCAPPTAMQLS